MSVMEDAGNTDHTISGTFVVKSCVEMGDCWGATAGGRLLGGDCWGATAEDVDPAVERKKTRRVGPEPSDTGELGR